MHTSLKGVGSGPGGVLREGAVLLRRGGAVAAAGGQPTRALPALLLRHPPGGQRRERPGPLPEAVRQQPPPAQGWERGRSGGVAVVMTDWGEGELCGGGVGCGVAGRSWVVVVAIQIRGEKPPWPKGFLRCPVHVPVSISLFHILHEFKSVCTIPTKQRQAGGRVWGFEGTRIEIVSVHVQPDMCTHRPLKALWTQQTRITEDE